MAAAVEKGEASTFSTAPQGQPAPAVRSAALAEKALLRNRFAAPAYNPPEPNQAFGDCDPRSTNRVDPQAEPLRPYARRLRVSKKWLSATFSSFHRFCLCIRSRAAKPAKYETLWVFIRSDAHVVRAGWDIRGCGPLSTPGFFDNLSRCARMRGGFCSAANPTARRSAFFRWQGGLLYRSFLLPGEKCTAPQRSAEKEKKQSFSA